MPAIGLLYPDHSAGDEHPVLEARRGPEVRLPVVDMPAGEDADRVDALLDLGGPDRLADGAGTLVEEHALDAVTAWQEPNLLGTVPLADGLGRLLGAVVLSRSLSPVRP